MPEDYGLGTGAKIKPWSDKNIVYEEVAGAVPFDWDIGFRVQDTVPVILDDQDGSFSCVSQAWRKLKEVLDYKETGTYDRLSARFIYRKIFVPQGGAYIHEGGNVLRDTGTPLEATVPSYEGTKPPSEAFMRSGSDSSAALEEAKAHKISTYAHVAIHFDTLASAIQRQNGVIAAFPMNNKIIYDAKGNGRLRLPKASEGEISNHCVLLTGAFKENGQKVIEHAGSWGTRHGRGGWFTMGEEWTYGGYLYSPITAVDMPNPIPAPHDPAYVFTRDLYYGVSGEDVRQLQKYLNTTPYKVAVSGDGSLGNETRFFGNLTKSAVARWQAGNGVTPVAGYFGPRSRAKYNELMGL